MEAAGDVGCIYSFGCWRSFCRGVDVVVALGPVQLSSPRSQVVAIGVKMG